MQERTPIKYHAFSSKWYILYFWIKYIQPSYILFDSLAVSALTISIFSNNSKKSSIGRVGMYIPSSSIIKIFSTKNVLHTCAISIHFTMTLARCCGLASTVISTVEITR